MAWRSPNGALSYEDGTFHSKFLWVMNVEQAQQLSVRKHESRKAAYVYPRSWAPGDITVKGRCENQAAYQELSLFIRTHQWAMINSPATDRFSRLQAAGQTTNGYRRLLQLSIPSEGILCRGWIDKFTLTNEGFAVVAPEFSFSFFIAFDQMAENIGISHQIKKVYTQDDNVFASRAKTPAPSDDGSRGDLVHERDERDYPGE